MGNDEEAGGNLTENGLTSHFLFLCGFVVHNISELAVKKSRCVLILKLPSSFVVAAFITCDIFLVMCGGEQKPFTLAPCQSDFTVSCIIGKLLRRT
jgi:hypothetical protein